MSSPVLEELRDTLVAGLRPSRRLRLRDGELAFQHHQLLAIRFQAAARLNGRGKVNGRERWATYFREHFPRGDTHAQLLWVRWRTPLLKHEAVGPGVIVAYGRPDAHWQRGSFGHEAGLVVDLESMCDDFERSVESFVEACRTDDRRA